jgi:hypothetical protein
MDHLSNVWGPGAMANMASPFRNADAGQTGCGIMIGSEHMPSCRSAWRPPLVKLLLQIVWCQQCMSGHMSKPYRV